MKKEIEISIPQGYEDVTLKKYLTLQKELKNYEGEEDAQAAVLVTYLCGIDSDILAGLGKKDYNTIGYELGKWISKTDFDLKRIITIDGVEYGFEPNLSNIAYGAYADITQYGTLTIDDNWAKIMSILYRPITKRVRDTYEIQKYNGEIDSDKFLEVSMDIHLGTLFFFVHLSTDLLKNILNSTKVEQFPPNIKSILERSGALMQLSLNLPTETLERLIELLKNR
jgi:hypothetical protein